MDFKLIGQVHEYESKTLAELSEEISRMSEEYKKKAEFYKKSKTIKLTLNQHKILSFLYSIYFLDSQNQNPRTWYTTREISESINVNSRGDWARKNCHKLLKMNFVSQNLEGKWYIGKYGIFYMHCETSDHDWPEDLIFNASVGALEKDLNIFIGSFIKSKIKEINNKFKEQGNNK